MGDIPDDEAIEKFFHDAQESGHFPGDVYNIQPPRFMTCTGLELKAYNDRVAMMRMVEAAEPPAEGQPPRFDGEAAAFPQHVIANIAEKTPDERSAAVQTWLDYYTTHGFPGDKYRMGRPNMPPTWVDMVAYEMELKMRDDDAAKTGPASPPPHYMTVKPKWKGKHATEKDIEEEKEHKKKWDAMSINEQRAVGKEREYAKFKQIAQASAAEAWRKAGFDSQYEGECVNYDPPPLPSGRRYSFDEVRAYFHQVEEKKKRWEAGIESPEGLRHQAREPAREPRIKPDEEFNRLPPSRREATRLAVRLEEILPLNLRQVKEAADAWYMDCIRNGFDGLNFEVPLEPVFQGNTVDWVDKIVFEEQVLFRLQYEKEKARKQGREPLMLKAVPRALPKEQAEQRKKLMQEWTWMTQPEKQKWVDEENFAEFAEIAQRIGAKLFMKHGEKYGFAGDKFNIPSPKDKQKSFNYKDIQEYNKLVYAKLQEIDKTKQAKVNKKMAFQRKLEIEKRKEVYEKMLMHLRIKYCTDRNVTEAMMKIEANEKIDEFLKTVERGKRAEKREAYARYIAARDAGGPGARNLKVVKPGPPLTPEPYIPSPSASPLPLIPPALQLPPSPAEQARERGAEELAEYRRQMLREEADLAEFLVPVRTIRWETQNGKQVAVRLRRDVLIHRAVIDVQMKSLPPGNDLFVRVAPESKIGKVISRSEYDQAAEQGQGERYAASPPPQALLINRQRDTKAATRPGPEKHHAISPGGTIRSPNQPVATETSPKMSKFRHLISSPGGTIKSPTYTKPRSPTPPPPRAFLQRAPRVAPPKIVRKKVVGGKRDVAKPWMNKDKKAKQQTDIDNVQINGETVSKSTPESGANITVTEKVEELVDGEVVKVTVTTKDVPNPSVAQDDANNIPGPSNIPDNVQINGETVSKSTLESGANITVTEKVEELVDGEVVKVTVTKKDVPNPSVAKDDANNIPGPSNIPVSKYFPNRKVRTRPAVEPFSKVPLNVSPGGTIRSPNQPVATKTTPKMSKFKSLVISPGGTIKSPTYTKPPTAQSPPPGRHRGRERYPPLLEDSDGEPEATTPKMSKFTHLISSPGGTIRSPIYTPPSPPPPQVIISSPGGTNISGIRSPIHTQPLPPPPRVIISSPGGTVRSPIYTPPSPPPPQVIISSPGGTNISGIRSPIHTQPLPPPPRVIISSPGGTVRSPIYTQPSPPPPQGRSTPNERSPRLPDAPNITVTEKIEELVGGVVVNTTVRELPAGAGTSGGRLRSSPQATSTPKRGSPNRSGHYYDGELYRSATDSPSSGGKTANVKVTQKIEELVGGVVVNTTVRELPVGAGPSGGRLRSSPQGPSTPKEKSRRLADDSDGELYLTAIGSPSSNAQRISTPKERSRRLPDDSDGELYLSAIGSPSSKAPGIRSHSTPPRGRQRNKESPDSRTQQTGNFQKNLQTEITSGITVPVVPKPPNLDDQRKLALAIQNSQRNAIYWDALAKAQETFSNLFYSQSYGTEARTLPAAMQRYVAPQPSAPPASRQSSPVTGRPGRGTPRATALSQSVQTSPVTVGPRRATSRATALSQSVQTSPVTVGPRRATSRATALSQSVQTSPVTVGPRRTTSRAMALSRSVQTSPGIAGPGRATPKTTALSRSVQTSPAIAGPGRVTPKSMALSRSVQTSPVIAGPAGPGRASPKTTARAKSPAKSPVVTGTTATATATAASSYSPVRQLTAAQKHQKEHADRQKAQQKKEEQDKQAAKEKSPVKKLQKENDDERNQEAINKARRAAEKAEEEERLREKEERKKKSSTQNQSGQNQQTSSVQEEEETSEPQQQQEQQQDANEEDPVMKQLRLAAEKIAAEKEKALAIAQEQANNRAQAERNRARAQQRSEFFF